MRVGIRMQCYQCLLHIKQVCALCYDPQNKSTLQNLFFVISLVSASKNPIPSWQFTLLTDSADTENIFSTDFFSQPKRNV